jgi:aminomethyltransferase
MEKKTPLYDLHLKLEGKIVPFAGYLLPIQYKTGVIAEHKAVRNACGLFDVSHMGEIILEGQDALDVLQELLVNDMSGMDIGRVRYSPMCNHKGGIVDDLVCGRMSDDRYMLVVNAANKDKDLKWITEHAKGRVQVTDLSDEYAQLALQGPRAKEILSKLTIPSQLPEKYYTFIQDVDVAGVRCMVSRTGYTGEFGYELYCKPSEALSLAEALLESGREEGLIACGLGARDTLRLEAGMPLYGHEMSDSITPMETGLSFFVKMDKPSFIGKEALIAAGMPKRTRVGLEMLDRGIAREHFPVYLREEQVGEITSGTMAPHLGKAIAMAMIAVDKADPDALYEVDVRGRRLKAKITDLPFYKRGK